MRYRFQSLVFLFVALFTLAIVGCKKDSEEEIRNNNNTQQDDPDGCDTSFIPGYEAHVKPIMSSYCTGCHGSAAGSAGVNLGTFEQVRDQSVRVIPSINHDSSLPQSRHMPPTGKLDACDILIIERWASHGFKE